MALALYLTHEARRRKRSITIAAATLLTAMAASVILASPAHAVPSGCTLHAYTPSYSQGTISYSGSVNCSFLTDDLYINVALYSDGQLVADTFTSCGRSSSCFDIGYHPNRAGNQRWCTAVFMTTRDTVWACENNSW